jgi:uncharacterized YigZ family protein
MADIIDTYLTVAAAAQASYTERRSRFIAHCVPVRSTEEVKAVLGEYRKQYFDARHVCYAYMLGVERTVFRSNDDGEPSGTAGKPILGQINSLGLTDVLVLVVRYFGGVKLGTGGLIVAYRAAAAACLAEAEVVERVVEVELTVSFDYARMNDVMRVVKDFSAAVMGQVYTPQPCLTLRIRALQASALRASLTHIQGCVVNEISE